MTTTTVSYANDIDVEVSIVASECHNCGVVYGLGAEFKRRRREDQRTFYCPNGHGAYYPKPRVSEAAKLREQLRTAEATETHLRDQLDSTERSRRAYKGKVTQIKRRVANGVCPCCRRSFADLQRHMSGQHPGFVPTDD